MSWSVGKLEPLLSEKVGTFKELPSKTTSELQVSGTGSLDVRPDVLRLRVVVSAEAETAQAAREASVQKMAPAVQSFRSNPFFVVIEAETNTQSVFTDPVPGQPRRVSYFVSETYIVVEARNSREVIKMIPGMISGSDLLDVSVFYDIQDRTRHQTQASRLAVADAYRVANGIVDAAGVEITGVLKISTRQLAVRGFVERSVRVGGAENEVAVPGGLVELLVTDKTIPVTAKVDIVFSISSAIKTSPAVRQMEPVSSIALVRDMARLTLENPFYRRVLQTTKEQQIALMSLRPGESIPEEVHDNMTQFIRVEQGAVEARVGSASAVVTDDQFVIVPSGVKHAVRQIGQVASKLYVIYSSSNGAFEHKDLAINTRQPELEQDSVPVSDRGDVPRAAAALRCEKFEE